MSARTTTRPPAPLTEKAMSDSLLLIHGCPVFLGTVRSHHWLWTRSWRSKASLSNVAWSSPLPLLRLRAGKKPCSLLQEADRGRKDGIHGPRTPLASRRQWHRPLCQRLTEKPTSYSPHCVSEALSQFPLPEQGSPFSLSWEHQSKSCKIKNNTTNNKRPVCP